MFSEKQILAGLCVVMLWCPVVGAEEVPRREQGQLVLEDIPEIPERIEARMLQYQNTRFASLQGWAEDGSGMFIRTRFAETSQVHFVAQPMGARSQLTFYAEPVRAAAVRPTEDARGFLFSKDIGGGEAYQIYYFDVERGQASLLTDGTSRHGGMLWSNAGDRFAYYSTARNGTDWDLYLGSPEGGSELLLEREGTWFPVDWSADDKHVLIGQYVSRNESRLLVLELATGALTEVNPSEEQIAYAEAAFSGDGEHLYLAFDQGGEFQTLMRYALSTGKLEDISSSLPWDVEALAVERLPEGDKVALTINEDGVSKLYLVDPQTLALTPVEGIPAGQIYGLDFDPTGGRLGFVLNTSKTPGDIYALELETSELTRWTQSEVGGLDTERFVSPELVRYPTFDKTKNGDWREIPAFVYTPPGEGPHPVLIRIHGGPEGQFRPYFSSLTQYLVVELGIAVVAPNVRGSSGYGKSYLKLDNGFLREDSVQDIGALLDWVGTQPQLDAARVAVQGGSYGGYMVLASMIHFGGRLACGIDNVGISNFVTFLENTKAYRRDLRRVEYGDERDPEMRAFLEKISPTARAHEITKPMLVVQGANDPRVPLGEAEQIVAAIREAGGRAWYLLGLDEGHGFRKKANRDVYMNTIVLFLEQHLL